MTLEARKTVSFALAMLTALAGGMNLIEEGKLRPGWLMVMAAGAGALVFFLRHRRPPPAEESGCAPTATGDLSAGRVGQEEEAGK